MIYPETGTTAGLNRTAPHTTAAAVESGGRNKVGERGAERLPS